MKILSIISFLFLSILPAGAQNAVTCGHVDDTSALQSALDIGPTIFLGHCLVCPLNLTNRWAFLHGLGAVFSDISPKAICPISSANSASIWSTITGHLFDFTGSYLCNVGDFSVGWFPDTSADVSIKDLFFVAQGSPSDGNIVALRNIFAKGKFLATGLYVYGIASGTVDNVQISNFDPGAYSTAAYLTGKNGWGLASQWATVLPVPTNGAGVAQVPRKFE